MPLLAELPAVQACHSVAGDIDLLVQASTPGALADLRERIAGLKGVDDVIGAGTAGDAAVSARRAPRRLTRC